MAGEHTRNPVYLGPNQSKPGTLPSILACRAKNCAAKRALMLVNAENDKKTTFTFRCQQHFPDCEELKKAGSPNFVISYAFPRAASKGSEGWRWRIHWGIDIAGEDGKATVHSVVRGKVTHLAQPYVEGSVKKFPGGFSGYGNTVVIESLTSPRYYYLYGHLYSISDHLSVGGFVEEGEQIGLVGRTAYSAENPEEMFKEKMGHLHFEVSRAPYPKRKATVEKPEEITDDNNAGKWVDPGLHLQQLGPWGGPPLYLPVSDVKSPELSAHELSASRLETAYNSVELHNDSGGYFPLGVNRMWHGGVHLTGPSDSLVRAPFAGEIVAVRLDHDVEKNQGHFGALSFILLRHEIPEIIYAKLQSDTQDGKSNPEETKWRGKSVGKYLAGKKGPKIDNPADLVAEVKARLAECEDDSGTPFYSPTPAALVNDGNAVDDDFIDAIVAFQSHISTGWAPDGVIAVPKTTWKALEKHLAQQREEKKKSENKDSSQSDQARRELYCLFMHLRAEGGLAFAEGRLALAKKLPWLSKFQLPLKI